MGYKNDSSQYSYITLPPGHMTTHYTPHMYIQSTRGTLTNVDKDHNPQHEVALTAKHKPSRRGTVAEVAAVGILSECPVVTFSKDCNTPDVQNESSNDRGGRDGEEDPL